MGRTVVPSAMTTQPSPRAVGRLRDSHLNGMLRGDSTRGKEGGGNDDSLMNHPVTVAEIMDGNVT